MTDLFDELLEETETGPRTDYPIRLNKFDFANIDEMRTASNEWMAVENRQQWKGFPHAMDTWFGGLYKPKPIKEPRLSTVGSTLKQLLETAEATQEWQQFRQSTVLDPVASALGAIAIGQQVTLPDDLPEENEDESKPQQLTEDQVGQLRRQIRKAVAQAEQDVENQRNAEALMWGQDEGSTEMTTHSPQERIALAKQVKSNPALLRLAEIVGRMRTIAAEKQRQKVIHGQDELVGIVRGHDLADVFPDEFITLMVPQLRNLFLYHYMDEALLQHSFEGKDVIARGPIVARVDISYSMCDRLSGPNIYGFPSLTKLEWALGVAIALAVIARKEKRDLLVGLFNTVMVKEWHFPKGVMTPDQIMELASYGVSGGTSFEDPLRSALQRITEPSDTGQPLTKADIVFITDGEAEVSAEFLEEYDKVKAAHEVQTFSILLSDGPTPPVVTRVSDDTVTVHNLQDAERAMDMAFSIGGRE
jgi:uncharacterized protein with von Willebrand factor type A (vWA) domain